MSAIAVVIPAHNATDNLRNASASLRRQTFREWQAVIVVDSSTDDTESLAAEIALEDDRFHVIVVEFGNPAATRNSGVQSTESTWLLFLDHDDWLAPDHLQDLYNAVQGDPSPDNPPIGFAYSGSVRHWPDGSTDEILPPSADHFRHLAHTCCFGTNAVLIRRELFETIGGFDTTLKTCEDWDLWQKMARMNPRRVATGACTGRYRMRRGSLSRSALDLLPDGDIVIARGHGEDDRLPPGDWQSGVRDPLGHLDRRYRYALWVLGVAIGSRSDEQDTESIAASAAERWADIPLDIAAAELRNGFDYASRAEAHAEGIESREREIRKIISQLDPERAEIFWESFVTNQPEWLTARSDLEQQSLERFRAGTEGKKAVDEALFDDLLATVSFSAGSTVIDAGAGNGVMSRIALEYGASVISYEARLDAAETLKQRHEEVLVRPIALSGPPVVTAMHSEVDFTEVPAFPDRSAISPALVNTTDANQTPVEHQLIEACSIDEDLRLLGVDASSVRAISAHLGGGEFHFLAGALAVLQLGRPVCMLFNAFHAPATNSYRPSELQELAATSDYTFLTPTGCATSAHWRGTSRLLMVPEEQSARLSALLSEAFARRYEAGGMPLGSEMDR